VSWSCSLEPLAREQERQGRRHCAFARGGERVAADIKLPTDDADIGHQDRDPQTPKGDVGLEKQGDNWKLTKPVDYAATSKM